MSEREEEIREIAIKSAMSVPWLTEEEKSLWAGAIAAAIRWGDNVNKPHKAVIEDNRALLNSIEKYKRTKIRMNGMPFSMERPQVRLLKVEHGEIV